MQPNKAKVYIFRMTVGGDRPDSYQDVCSPAVSILDAKIHKNIAIYKFEILHKSCQDPIRNSKF